MARLRSTKAKYYAVTDALTLGVGENSDQISHLAFKMATQEGLTKFNMADGVIDEFEDNTGVDTSASSAETYDTSVDTWSGASSSAADATGGTITQSGGNTIHTYNTAENGVDNDLVVPGGTGDVTYLVVAGGGGGGGGYAGGGGAGGYRTASGFPVTGQTYTIVAGAGGENGTYSPNTDGTDGANSSFSTITSTGGGGGGASREAGHSGGSGGGGNDGGGSGPGNTPSTSPSQGNSGGSGPGNYGGGGGGASGGGQTASPGVGGNGTASSISGSSVTYAGGGGGGAASPTVAGCAGGSGGGGPGGSGIEPGNSNLGPSGSIGVPGTDGLGGGGGGGGYTLGGDGGNGIVIISYTTDQFTSTAYNDMTLISTATTASAAPTNARIILHEQATGTITIGTDIKAYVSRDNGTTYTEFTNLALEANYESGKRILSGSVDISAQPAGTSVRYKVRSYNTTSSKYFVLHGASLTWS